MSAQEPRLGAQAPGALSAGGQAERAGSLAPGAANEGSPEIEAWVSTFAKGKHITYNVVVLKSGKIVNMNTLVPAGPMEVRKLLELDGITAELVIKNSWNNRHAFIKLPANAVIAMVEIEDKDTIKYKLVHGEGQLLEEIERERDEQFVYVRKVLYLVTAGKKFRITTLMQRSMAIVKIKRQGNSVIVSGNTFPIKDSIKSIGGRWDPQSKVWILSAAKLDALKQFAVVEEV